MCGPASRPRRHRHPALRYPRRRPSGAARSPATDPSRGPAPPRCPCRRVRPGDALLVVDDRPLTRRTETLVGGVQVQRLPEFKRRRTRLGLDGDALDPLADGVGGQFGGQLVLHAHCQRGVGAMDQSASCTRRRIHQPAGRGPRNVHTRASLPTWSTASMMSCAPPLQPGDGRVGIVRRLSVAHVAGVKGSSRRSATICAAHRWPRPTCRKSWLSVQPGQVGTGVDGSPLRITSPKARVCSSSAARKSTLRTYRARALPSRIGTSTIRAAPWCRDGYRPGQPRLRIAVEERPQPDFALGPGECGAEAEVPTAGE